MATIKHQTVCVRERVANKWLEYSYKNPNGWLIGDFLLYFMLLLNSKIGYLKEFHSSLQNCK